MKAIITLAFAGVLGLGALVAAPGVADARKGHHHGPRISHGHVGLPIGGGKHHGFYGGHRKFRVHRKHRHRYNISPWVYSYTPYYYYRPRNYNYTPYRYYGRCQYWANKCARNWGWHNRNWRGCMRYYGCY